MTLFLGQGGANESQQGNTSGESRIPKNNYVFHHMIASFYHMSCSQPSRPRTPPIVFTLINKAMHELALNISGPCIVSTIISLVNQAFSQERLKSFQVLWEKVNSFFLFLLRKIVWVCQIDEFFFSF